MARITVTVSPGAAQSELIGRHGDGWKARVAARPERGRANAALITLLAATLGIPRDRVRVVAGRTSRRKVVEIESLHSDEVARRLGP